MAVDGGMTDEELRELGKMTLHGSPPFETFSRLYAAACRLMVERDQALRDVEEAKKDRNLAIEEVGAQQQRAAIMRDEVRERAKKVLDVMDALLAAPPDASLAAMRQQARREHAENIAQRIMDMPWLEPPEAERIELPEPYRRALAAVVRVQPCDDPDDG